VVEMTDCRLLIVDDEQKIINALKRILRKESFECFFAMNGKEALSIIENNEIHVILSDLDMPGMDGIALLKKVKKRYPDIIRLILSGRSDSQTVLNAVNDGNILRYITKPWNAKEIISILKQAFDLFFLKKEKNDLLKTLQGYNLTLEQKVAQKTRELVKMKNIAEIGKHSSQIVHNLNNPLNATQGALQLIEMMVQDNNPDIDKINRYIQISRKSINDMGQIISSILIHARDKQTFYTETFDLNKVIKSSLTLFELDSFFKKEVKKEIDMQENMPVIKGNRAQIKQIFDNLIKNAMDSMEETSEKTLFIKTWHEKNSIIIKISDTGCGISHDNLDKVFSPDFTTKPVGKGTGLGLASVKSMVEGYHGKIDVTSKLKGGTTFIIKLPV
jgi:signal transduction histidine kinase